MPNPSAESRDLAYEVAPPIGSIIAWHPRLFNAAGNVGVDSADRITLGACYEYADGSIITAQDSPLKNGAYERKPDLTDNRFLMGGLSTIGFLGDIDIVYGGTNHAGPPVLHDNNGDNSLTISNPSLPTHVHNPGTLYVSAYTGDDTPDHVHSYFSWYVYNVHGGNGGDPTPGGVTYNTGGASARHIHYFSIASNQFGGATDDGGFPNNAINILPKYLLVKYIMRVK